MRASKKAAKSRVHRAERCTQVPDPQPPIPDIHISGAEGICFKREIQLTIQKYIDRAQTHPRGRPDRIVVSVERLKKTLQSITALPVTTIRCGSSARARQIIAMLLKSSGVSENAIITALSVLQSKESMRGASLVLASSGRRIEPDIQRGVRASRFGIARSAETVLAAQLDIIGINTQTVREALVLASKVASCRDVIAEVCISDDPDYTTGYVASANLGYIRIPHCKKKHDRRGGRIIILREDVDIRCVIQYLEKTPVIIKSIKPCSGEKTIDEILDHNN